MNGLPHTTMLFSHLIHGMDFSGLDHGGRVQEHHDQGQGRAVRAGASMASAASMANAASMASAASMISA